MDDASLAAFFDSRPPAAFSHVICTLGPSAGVGSILGADGLSGLRKQFDLKFFAQMAVVAHAAPKTADGGAVVVTTGALAKRPGKGSTALAAANGALEARWAAGFEGFTDADGYQPAACLRHTAARR